MQRLRKAQAAFTLIELMVVIAIIAILVTIASPSFTEMQRNSELVSATNNLIATLNNARSEAMKNGAYAGITPSAGGTDWNTKITSFVDRNFDTAYNAGDTLIKETELLPSYLTITSSNTASTSILFNASGYLVAQGGFSNTTLSIARNDVTTAEKLAQTRRVVLAATGRVRSCKPTGATDDDCKVNALN